MSVERIPEFAIEAAEREEKERADKLKEYSLTISEGATAPCFPGWGAYVSGDEIDGDGKTITAEDKAKAARKAAKKIAEDAKRRPAELRKLQEAMAANQPVDPAPPQPSVADEVLDIPKPRRTSGTRDEQWAILEGETAAAVCQQVGQILCVGDEWYVERGGIWEPTERDCYRKVALDALPLSWRTEAHGASVMRRIEAENQVSKDQFVGAAKFDADGAVLLAIQGGIVRISADGDREPEILPPDASHYFTMALPVRYDPEAESPEFDEVLTRALPDEQDRNCLLDVLATAFIPDGRFEAALVCQGEAGSSKSTVMSPVERIFGKSCSSLSMGDLCHPTGYKLAGLQHKLINIATELSTTEVEDTDIFKRLVSAETINARAIYGKPFDMRSHATLVFLANSLPRFKYGTAAEVRRLKFVRFARVVCKPDVTLKDRVAAEAAGVFVKLVQRAWTLLSGTPISEPGKFSQETYARFGISNDPVGQFVKLYCETGHSLQREKGDLICAFSQFRDRYGISERFDDCVFLRNLYERFPSITAKRVRVDGVRVQRVFGVMLRDEELEESEPVTDPVVTPAAPKKLTKAQRQWEERHQMELAKLAEARKRGQN